MRLNAFDDGLRPELLESSLYDGIFEIPRLEPLSQIILPTGLVPFSKRKRARDRFVHFYEHEAHYQDFTNHPERFVQDLAEHPGIISPDNSLLVEAPLCAQIANLFLSRRNASFLHRQGIYQIPNVRWGDERTFTTIELPEAVAFVGIPRDSIVSVGTYGCSQTRDEKRLLHLGFIEMLNVLRPRVVVVYGSMPRDVFCEFPYEPKFLQFENWDAEKRRLKRNLPQTHLHDQCDREPEFILPQA